MKLARSVLSLAECAAWVFGLTALATWGAGHLAGLAGARQDLQRFEALRVPAQSACTRRDGHARRQLLGAQRASGPGRRSRRPASAAARACCAFRGSGSKCRVLPGTDDATLDRGVGHIEDTAQPGTDGNAGIAGHRDGFFRGLKDIRRRRRHRAQTPRWPGDLSRRADLDCRARGRLGAGPDAVAVADAGHLLPVLLRRLGAAAVHRPSRECRQALNIEATTERTWLRRQ